MRFRRFQDMKAFARHSENNSAKKCYLDRSTRQSADTQTHGATSQPAIHCASRCDEALLVGSGRFWFAEEAETTRMDVCIALHMLRSCVMVICKIGQYGKGISRHGRVSACVWHVFRSTSGCCCKAYPRRTRGWHPDSPEYTEQHEAPLRLR